MVSRLCIFLGFLLSTLCNFSFATCDGGCCNTVLWQNIGGNISDNIALSAALAGLAPTANPVFTGTIGTALTPSRAVITDGFGNLSTSISSTTLSYVDINSSLTGLLALKAPLASPTFTGTITMPLGSGIVHSSSGGVLSSSAVSLTADVSGVLPIANGGSGLATGSQNLAFATPNGSTGAPSFRKLVAGDLSSGASADRLPLVTDGSGNYSIGYQYICAGTSGGNNCQTFLFDDGTIGKLSLRSGTNSANEIYITNNSGAFNFNFASSTPVSLQPQTKPTGVAGGTSYMGFSNTQINNGFWAHFPSSRVLLSPSTNSQVIFHAQVDTWTFLVGYQCNIRLFDANDKVSWAYYRRTWDHFGNSNTNTASVITAAGVPYVANQYSSNATFSDGNTNLTGYICTDSVSGNNWDFCLKIDNQTADSVMATVDCDWYTAHYN